MYLKNIIKGKAVSLKSVDLDDAEFIVKIRNDNSKNMYLHAVPNDIKLQEKWIENQKNRLGDYYFVIYDNNLKKCGLASIYDINETDHMAEFGRWISWGNSVQNIESVILAFDFAFNNFNINTIYMRTMYDNKAVRSFWKRFGAESLGKVYEMDLWIEKTIVTREHYYNELRDKNLQLVDFFIG